MEAPGSPWTRSSWTPSTSTATSAGLLCKEGDAFPTRTVELLKGVDAALFGAITSKPVKAARPSSLPSSRARASPTAPHREDAPALRSLRLPPANQGYPGNPLNFKEGIDLVVFRENTEDLYAGVEFQRRAHGARGDPHRALEAFRPLRQPRRRPVRRVLQDQHEEGLGADRPAPPSSSRRKHGRKKVTVVHKANVVRATDGLFLEEAKKVARECPDIQTDDANIDAICMWLLKNPFAYDVLVAPNLYGDIISTSARRWWAASASAARQHRRVARRLRAHSRLAPKYAGQYKGEPHRHDPRRQDDARLAGREGEGGPDGAGGGRGDQGRSRPHLRHGREELDPREWGKAIAAAVARRSRRSSRR